MTTELTEQSASASGLTLNETRGMIDALHSPVALLDREGCILSVNRAWAALDSESTGHLQCSELGADYQQICEQAARHADTDAGLFAQGLSAVLSGDRAAFEMQTPCPVGDELHVFRARVTRLSDSRGPYFLVSRQDVSADGQAFEA